MTAKRVYMAGPLFNMHERAFLEQITARLEAEDCQVFLPHRDAGVLRGPLDTAERRRLFQGDLDALNACDMVVALLTGADHDSGTSAELGYAFARGIPCFGISDDGRWLNNIIWGICGEGRRIAATVDDLLAMVAAYRRE